MKNLIYNCPSCEEKMVASELKCPSCDIAIKGEFMLPTLEESNIQQKQNEFSTLNDNELSFVKLFIKNEGNLKKTCDDMNYSYSQIKETLKDLNKKLGNYVEEETMVSINNDSLDNKGAASKRIIEALLDCGGKAQCEMLRGEDIIIYLTKDGVQTSSVANYTYKWEEFDAILEKAQELGGKMYKGDGAAQSGARIGSKEFPKDTIDAFIAINFYGQREGETVFRRSTYYAAIMAWAGICDNCRSDGFGGYIQLKPNYLNK